MSRNVVVGTVAVVLLVLIGWYVSSQQKSAVPTPRLTPTPTRPPAKTATPSGEVREIKVSGSEFAFSPSALSVKAGKKVRIIFKNNGKLPHNLTIDQLGIATKTISPGQTDTLEFTADRTGSFVVYCSVDAHRQKGMEVSLKIQ